MVPLDPSQLRLSFVAYGGMNRKDWRTVSVDDVGFDERELEEQLNPVLSGAAIERLRGSGHWAKRLVEECRQALSKVLPLRAGEREFLDRLVDDGEVRPELLTTDAAVAARIATHPMLLWKAVNVRAHRMA